MKNILCVALCLIAFLNACKQDTKTGVTGSEFANINNLSGNWYAVDFCARSNQYGSVLQAMNNASKPFAYAVTFDPAMPDSAICYNGMETWSQAIKINKDTIELVGAVQGKSVFMVYNSQNTDKVKEINMFDATGGTVALNRFLKSKAETKSGEVAFKMALNYNLLDGNFSNKGSNVRFETSGVLKGLDNYDHYEICTAGDCFMAGQDVDIISLSKGKERKFFGYRYNKTNDTLRLYNIVETNPAEKGTGKLSNLAYTLPRKIKK